MNYIQSTINYNINKHISEAEFFLPPFSLPTTFTNKAILHYWLNGTHSVKEIQQATSIPLCTVECNLKKLRETGTVE